MVANLHRLIADDFKAEMKYDIVLGLIIKLKYPKSEKIFINDLLEYSKISLSFKSNHVHLLQFYPNW